MLPGRVCVGRRGEAAKARVEHGYTSSWDGFPDRPIKTTAPHNHTLSFRGGKKPGHKPTKRVYMASKVFVNIVFTCDFVYSAKIFMEFYCKLERRCEFQKRSKIWRKKAKFAQSVITVLTDKAESAIKCISALQQVIVSSNLNFKTGI